MNYAITPCNCQSLFGRAIKLLFIGIVFLSGSQASLASSDTAPATMQNRASTSKEGDISPVMDEILQKLGITKTTGPTPVVISTPTPTPSSNNHLTAIEKLALAYTAQKQAEAKNAEAIEPPKEEKTERTPTAPVNDKQAFSTFYGAQNRKPLWVSSTGLLESTKNVLKEFRHADDYGLRPKDFASIFSQTTSDHMTARQLANFELSMSRTVLKYANYARGGRIDPRKLSRFQDRGPEPVPARQLLDAFAKSSNRVKTLRSYHPPHPEFEALRQKLIALNKSSTSAKKKSSREKLRARLLINMERWRWMPRKLAGDNNIYVWANVPELRVRIIRDGKIIFNERAIAGKPSKQSPMFSDQMEWIEFNPTWFIPNSIKVADILPSLRRKGRVMSRYHLKLDCGKYGSDFKSINWKKVDIRNCAVTQPTGNKSVLGKLKFKFPNKHSVYMHDTLTPGLFNQKHRILSHGCIRVRNPRRMAEVLLANDKGMSSKRVGSLLAQGGLHTEYLSHKIPVHITYFSTRVKKDGSLSHYPDYYGHDKRLAQALLGKGHLFKGAIYRGSQRVRRKRKRTPRTPSAPALPAFFQNQ